MTGEQPVVAEKPLSHSSPITLGLALAALSFAIYAAFDTGRASNRLDVVEKSVGALQTEQKETKTAVTLQDAKQIRFEGALARIGEKLDDVRDTLKDIKENGVTVNARGRGR